MMLHYFFCTPHNVAFQKAFFGCRLDCILLDFVLILNIYAFLDLRKLFIVVPCGQRATSFVNDDGRFCAVQSYSVCKAQKTTIVVRKGSNIHDFCSFKRLVWFSVSWFVSGCEGFMPVDYATNVLGSASCSAVMFLAQTARILCRFLFYAGHQIYRGTSTVEG